MRKFIISDVHGFGNFYYAVMNYLDNISQDEEIELYINGDLIDRGNESVDILLDVYRRIIVKNPKFKVEYLGGNHELMMYEVYNRYLNGRYVPSNMNWFLAYNEGKKTDQELQARFKDNKKGLIELTNFIGNLNIYHKFSENINGKPIVLVHAACPLKVKNNCHLKISDDWISYYIWTREAHLLESERLKIRIGHNKYFTIIGHTPNDNVFGYYYNKEKNYLNIDGGVAYFVNGFSEYNHFPLVEVCDSYLKILTFDNTGEIIYGNYFNGTNSSLFTENELEKEKKIITKKISLS